ncbi:peptidylprolyl isomerase [Bacteroidia bacterium]|nr:peptidylprolyl isomerase [Bacteroidia bacterium]
MKMKIFAALLFAVALAAGEASGQMVVADKVAAVVGGSAILYSDMDEMSRMILQERREKGYTLDRDPKIEALEALMLQKLLYNQALVDSINISTDDIQGQVDASLQQMVKARGSMAALEAYYHKPLYSIREDIAQQIEEARYAQRMEDEIRSKVRITPGEVEKYFKRIPKDSLPLVPEQYSYAQITKFPPSTAEAKQRVKERLLELRERILGGTKFELLARMYSADGSAIRGGEMDPTPKEGFVKPFSDAMVKLKPGQISEVVETEFGFHIIQMIDKDGNLYRVRHILMRPMFTDSEITQTTELLDSVARLISDQKMTFAEAAKEFSDDPYSKLNGGVVSNHDMLEMYNAFDAKLTTTLFLKEDLPKEDYMVLRGLQIDQVSDSFQAHDLRGNVMAKVVKLLRIIPAHSATLKEDYVKLEEAALEAKCDLEFQKWLKKKIDGMYVRIEPEFRSDDFQNRAWLK